MAKDQGVIKSEQPRRTKRAGGYERIEDYGLISDCHSLALVSRRGSIDWCCMPSADSASIFGRILDSEVGGYCAIETDAKDPTFTRSYIGDSMVLKTGISDSGGEVEVEDLFTMREGGRRNPHRQLIRVVRGIRGSMSLSFAIAPRFDYGAVAPWIRQLPGNAGWAAIGGANGLLVSCDARLRRHREHELRGDFTVRAGDVVRLSMVWMAPELLDAPDIPLFGPKEIDDRVTTTLAMWHKWVQRGTYAGPDAAAARRSALVLKSLSSAESGAIIAAATTSLPEWIGADRNYDYRYSWVRDSVFSADSLAEVGCDTEADFFRRFIQRSAAGSGQQLQIMYGLAGQRSIPERELTHLNGYEGSRPVRIGNAASQQLQLDAYGHLVWLSWQWHLRGYSPDDDYWRFLIDLVDTAAERWEEPDCGLWEVRGQMQHFVHSKVMCWVALDRGVALARESLRKAPIQRWAKTAARIREAVETKGYDSGRGVFVQYFGTTNLDASLLLIPITNFVAYDDPRMLRTVAAIREDLDQDGFVARYRTTSTDDGFASGEGRFLACSFWMAECLARQGDLERARAVFDRVSSTRNDLGLFSEEYDPIAKRMLGNFPQALTHLSHLQAAVTLNQELRHLVAGSAALPDTKNPVGRDADSKLAPS